MSDQIDISRGMVEHLCHIHRGYEQHGTVAMLLALRAALDAAEADRDELAAVISGVEVSNGLTDNGNLWRFWSSKCKELAQKVVAAEAEKARAVEAEEDRILDLIDTMFTGALELRDLARKGLVDDVGAMVHNEAVQTLAQVRHAIRTGAKP